MHLLNTDLIERAVQEIERREPQYLMRIPNACDGAACGSNIPSRQKFTANQNVPASPNRVNRQFKPTIES